MTYDEVVPSVLKRDNYHYHRKQGNIIVHGAGGNGRKTFIEYETAYPDFKAKVKELYGNPYDYLAKQPILDLIYWDYQAHAYYTNFVLPNGSKLPASDVDAMGKEQINYVDRYTKCINWLNMLGKMTTDKRALKQMLNISIGDFWEIVTGLIRSNNIALNTNAKRLKETLKEFSSYVSPEDRWYYILEKDLHRWGNANSKKRDEEGEALIFKMLSDSNNHDDTVIAAAYNVYARNNGKSEYTAGAIAYIRRQNEHIIKATRDGAKKAYNKYSKEIGRKRPSAPMLLLNGDDNNLDMYFKVVTRDKNGKKVTNNFYRPVLYVVIDTYNNYILGYSYGNESTKELIYDAYRNAVNHVHELTGGYFMPHQLQSDRWGLDIKLQGDLAQFYKGVAGVFTPQANGVPQGKYIEASFGTTWHQMLKVMPYGNYAGHNITAKERKNQEAIAINAKDHPSIDEMPRIIEEFITLMRMTVHKKSTMTRQQQWLDQFWKSQKAQQNRIDTATKLTTLGRTHKNPLTITTKGIQGMIEGQKLRFDLPDEVIWKHNGAKVEVLYDPENLNEVLITDGKKLRFVANQYQEMPAAIADYQEGDGQRLHQLFESKRAISARLTSDLQEKLSALDGTDIDPAGLLQAGVLLKDLKNGAEAAYLQQLYGKRADLPAFKSTEKVTDHHYEDSSDDDVTNLY